MITWSSIRQITSIRRLTRSKRDNRALPILQTWNKNKHEPPPVKCAAFYVGLKWRLCTSHDLLEVFGDSLCLVVVTANWISSCEDGRPCWQAEWNVGSSWVQFSPTVKVWTLFCGWASWGIRLAQVREGQLPVFLPPQTQYFWILIWSGMFFSRSHKAIT